MEMIYTYKRQSGYINTQIVSLDINIYIYIIGIHSVQG